MGSFFLATSFIIFSSLIIKLVAHVSSSMKKHVAPISMTCVEEKDIKKDETFVERGTKRNRESFKKVTISGPQKVAKLLSAEYMLFHRTCWCWLQFAPPSRRSHDGGIYMSRVAAAAAFLLTW